MLIVSEDLRNYFRIILELACIVGEHPKILLLIFPPTRSHLIEIDWIWLMAGQIITEKQFIGKSRTKYIFISPRQLVCYAKAAPHQDHSRYGGLHPLAIHRLAGGHYLRRPPNLLSQGQLAKADGPRIGSGRAEGLHLGPSGTVSQDHRCADAAAMRS